MSPRHLTSVCVLLALTACERSSGRFDELDQPPAPFVALGPATPIEQLQTVAERRAAMEAARKPKQPTDECGRRKGRDPQGACVTLATRELEHVQRVQIPAGEFVMGALPGDYGGMKVKEAVVRWSGQPPRPFRLPSYWIDLHEVTRAAYAGCVAAGKCTEAVCPAGQVDPTTQLELTAEVQALLPQTCVSHEQAAAFCAANGGRLPSEAEWEYAARGVDARIYPWGNKIEDQIPNAIYPAGRVREDSSYFGILGLGSNVVEWVQERYDPDAGLRPFLTGEFRDPEGPSVLARRAFERGLVCGTDAACEGPPEAPLRHVLKHSSAGDRAAGRDEIPASHPGTELEGWTIAGRGPKVGFRCAADLGPDVVPLTVPAPAMPVPLYRVEGTLQIFGGVAEAVSHAEARRYCAALTVPDGAGPPLTGWRLPLQGELPALAPSFRGPGPFWAEEGAVAQSAETSPVPPDAPWEPQSIADEAPLLARCVRP